MRALALILAIALLVITTTSAYIRFTQAGLGCADWPACYGAQVEALTPSLDEADPLFLPRALHRVAAGSAGILVLVIAVIGWERWGRQRAQWVAVALVLLAAALAWLGRMTPSPLPIVALGNLLGGMAMLALAMRLFVSPSAGDRAPVGGNLLQWVRVAVLLGVAQIALGGLIGARFGATVCNSLPGCAIAPGLASASAAVFNPLITTTSLTIEAGAIEALHLAHRAVALMLALVAVRIALFAPNLGDRQRQAAYAIGVFVAAQIASGAWFILQPTLGLAVVHNIGAAFLLASFASLAVLIAPSRFEITR
jgi:heme a synthase